MSLPAAGLSETSGSTGIILDSIPSTNQYLSDRWSAAAPYSWVAAREQTAGRGRLGRKWDTPKSTALLASILTTIRAGDMDPALATMAASLAAARLIRSELPASDVTLKWPNDVLLGGRKVAGILAEYAGQRGADHLVVVGVGLNLTTPSSYLEQFNATSLYEHGWPNAGITVDDSQLFRLGGRLSALLETAVARGSIARHFEEQCATIGQNITVTMPGGKIIAGTASGITPTGELLVGDIPLRAGEVTLRKDTQLDTQLEEVS